MEAGEYGLTRGTCFVARRLEVIAVAGLLWISGVFWVRRDFFAFFIGFISSNAHGLLQVCGRLAAFTSLLVIYYSGLQSDQVPGMYLRSSPTMEHIFVPVHRHPQHSFVVQRSVS